MVISILALVLALGGTAIAGGLISGKSIKKRSEPGNRLKKDTVTGKEVKEKTLKSVGDALKLGGIPASGYVPASKLARFSVRLGFGQSQPLLSAGPLTFTAKCVQNGTDDNGNANADFLDIIVSTSQNGAVFDGFDALRGDAGPTSFLNTNSLESDRVFYENSVPTGTVTYDAESNSDGAALAADGTAVSFNNDGLGVSLNEFGTGCTANGFAVVAS